MLRFMKAVARCALIATTATVLAASGLWLVRTAAHAQGNAPLPVPFIGQLYTYSECNNRTFGVNNCGPASLAMILDANGKRAAGRSNKEFVDFVRTQMTGDDFACDQGYTDWGELDNGASCFGLCNQREGSTAQSLDDIRRLNAQCLPVIILIRVDDAVAQWIANPDFFDNDDHFMVSVGFQSGNVLYKNPLAANAPAAGHWTATEGQMEHGLEATSSSQKGKAYGGQLGTCDCAAAPCQSPAAGPLPGGSSCPAPPGAGGGGNPGGQPGSPAPDTKFDRIIVSMGTTCTDGTVELFYAANGKTSFSGRRMRRKFIRPDSWDRVVFDMDGHNDYRNELTKLRLDPTGNGDCFVGLSYIWITNDDEDTAEFYPFYEESDDPNRPLQHMLGWFLRYLTDLGPADSWHLWSQGVDPQVINDGIEVDTGYR